MHTLLEQIRAQIGNVKEYVNKGHHHRAIVTELEKIEKRFAEYEEVAALASLAPAAVEVDAVERALKVWFGGKDPLPPYFDWTNYKDEMQAALAAAYPALTAQLAALTAQCEADAKRLDWIEKWIFQAHWGANVSGPCTTWSIQTAWRHKTRLMYGPNDFRAAIDSAIAAGNV
jgi:hypothetical protein